MTLTTLWGALVASFALAVAAAIVLPLQAKDQRQGPPAAGKDPLSIRPRELAACVAGRGCSTKSSCITGEHP